MGGGYHRAAVAAGDDRYGSGTAVHDAGAWLH